MKRNLPVSGLMTRKISFVSPSDNLEKVRHLFEEKGFHHVPVTEAGKLIGIVSYTDYLRIIRDFFNIPRDGAPSLKPLDSMLVGEMMTLDPVCIHPDDPLEKAIGFFRKNQFHSLPVTESDGKLVGILTTYDVMKIMEDAIAPEFSYNE